MPLFFVGVKIFSGGFSRYLTASVIFTHSLVSGTLLLVDCKFGIVIFFRYFFLREKRDLEQRGFFLHRWFLSSPEQR